MKKFIGYINGEKFEDANIFTEKLKELDWSKENSIKSEYYEESTDTKVGTAQLQEPKSKSIKFDVKKLQDQSYIVTDEDVQNMSNYDLIIVGNEYLNRYNNLQKDITNAKNEINSCEYFISKAKADIDKYTKIQATTQDKLDDSQKEFELIKNTGRDKIIDVYKEKYAQHNLKRLYFDELSPLFKIFGF